jgi:hypothetical protein
VLTTSSQKVLRAPIIAFNFEDLETYQSNVRYAYKIYLPLLFPLNNMHLQKKYLSLLVSISSTLKEVIMDNSAFSLLTQINTPEDLRQLKVEQLPELCRELRQYIWEVLAQNPGHLASSLGVI